MLFEFKAYFYTKESENKPLFHCRLGIQGVDLGGELESKGFKKKHPKDFFLDYTKANCSIEEVLSFTAEGYREDVNTIINYGKFYGVEYENIRIDAEEVETITDYGGIPPLLFIAHDWAMTYKETDSNYPIHFWGGEKSDPNGKSHHYDIPAYVVKQAFNALTMEEAREKFSDNKDILWSVKDMERFFAVPYENRESSDATNNNHIHEVIDDLEYECKSLSSDIIKRKAKSIIRRIRKQLPDFVIDDGLAGLGMNIIDQMAIYYQSRSYEEFCFGFADYLDDIIQDEIDNLSATDRLILEHRDLTLLSRGEMENNIFADLKSEVSSIIDNHFHSAKIQRFINRYNINY